MAKYFGFQTKKSILDTRTRSSDTQAPTLKELDTPIYIHLVPQEGSIYRYGYHYVPIMKKVKKNGRERYELGKTVYTCLRETAEGCPICDFISKLSKTDEFSSDDVIMEFGTGRNKNTFTLNDVIGKSSQYTKSLKVAISVLIAYVDHNNPDVGQRPLIITNGLLNKIIFLIEESIAEGFGDPLEGDESYAFKLNYRPDADTAQDMYTVTAAYKKVADDYIMEQLEKDVIDLEAYVKPPNRNAMLKYLNENVLEDVLEALEIPSYDEDEEDEADFDFKKTERKRSRKQEVEEVEDDSDDEEERPKRKRRKSSREKTERKSAREKRQKATGRLRCPSCREYITAEDDECEYCGYDLGDSDYD